MNPLHDAAWLIWSNEHRAWWAPARRGYTRSINAAGRYSFAEATSIAAHPRDWGVPDEVVVPSPELQALIAAERMEAVA